MVRMAIKMIVKDPDPVLREKKQACSENYAEYP